MGVPDEMDCWFHECNASRVIKSVWNIYPT
jgi:hypothetical protein